jgi:hypothetical protein
LRPQPAGGIIPGMIGVKPRTKLLAHIKDELKVDDATAARYAKFLGDTFEASEDGKKMVIRDEKGVILALLSIQPV